MTDEQIKEIAEKYYYFDDCVEKSMKVIREALAEQREEIRQMIYNERGQFYDPNDALEYLVDELTP
jgi:hypothetical protein